MTKTEATPVNALWRWLINQEHTSATMPKGTKIVSATLGSNGLHLYGHVQTADKDDTEERHFMLARTGEPLPQGASHVLTLATGTHLVEIPADFATA